MDGEEIVFCLICQSVKKNVDPTSLKLQNEVGALPERSQGCIYARTVSQQPSDKKKILAQKQCAVQIFGSPRFQVISDLNFKAVCIVLCIYQI